MFFVIVGLCLAFAGLLMGAMTLLGDTSPTVARPLALAALIGVAMRWLFGSRMSRR